MRRLVLLIGTASVLTFLPLVLPTYFLGLLTQLLILAIFAMGTNILVGYTGLPTFGHGAFFGVGAYTLALLTTRFSPNFWLDMPVSILTTGLIAAIFGSLAIRARGAYFVMLTLALNMVVWGLIVDWTSLTGGDLGIHKVPRPEFGLPWSLRDGTNFHYFTFFFFVLTSFALYRLVRSAFGFSLVGIRARETRMRSLGYNVWLYQFVAFILSGIFAGLAGSLWAYYQGSVSPSEAGFELSAEVLLAILVGGPNSLFGPAIGVVVIMLVKYIVSIYTERWLFVLGAMYVIATICLPQGLIEPLRAKLGRGEKKIWSV